MNFGLIILNQYIKTEQNYVTWILTSLLFILYFHEDIADDVEKCFDISSCSKDDNRPLTIGCNKKVIGVFKDELGRKIMKKLFGPRAKTWPCLMDDDTEHRKA